MYRRLSHIFLVACGISAFTLVGLFIYNIRAKADPTLSVVGGASLALPYQATDMVVHGSYGYMTFSNIGNDGFRIIDLTNPSAPTVVGGASVAMPSIGESGSYARALGVKGDHAFIVTEAEFTGAAYLFSVNIANPANPSVAYSGLNISAQAPSSMVVHGNRAFVLTNEGGLIMVDISNPTGPFSVLSSTVLGMPNMQSLESVVVSGDYAYVAGTDQSVGPAVGKLYILDLVSNPTRPTLVGSVSLGASPADPLPQKLFLHGRYAYVTRGGTTTSALQIVDVNTPETPVLVEGVSFNGGTPGAAGFVTVGEDFGYLARYDANGINPGSIVSVDFADPANPAILGSSVQIDAGMPIRKIIQSGPYVYVAINNFADEFGQLRILSTNVASTQSAGVPFFTNGSPAQGASGVATNSGVTVTSSEPLLSSSVNTNTVLLHVCTGATNPNACSSPGQDNLCTSVSVAGTTIACNHNALSSGTVYRMQVASGVTSGDAVNAVGTYEAIFMVGGALANGGGWDLIPPDPITNFAATTDGVSIALAWENPKAKDVHHIEILRNNGGSSPINGGEPLVAFMSSEKVTNYTDTNVLPAESYAYEMRARDWSGNYSTLTPEVAVWVVPPRSIQNSEVQSSADGGDVWSREFFALLGTPMTKTLPSAERSAVWSDYVTIYGRDPSRSMIELMANGVVPMHALAWERAEMDSVVPYWYTISSKQQLNPYASVGRDRVMFEIIMYRLRFPVSLKHEVAAQLKFKQLFGRVPTSDRDWSVVRALAYAN